MRINKYHDSFGFTVVELLVVIVVIGILATISIVAYTGVNSKAVAASIQSDLSNNSRLLNLYNTDYGSYPTALSSNCPSSPSADSKYCLKVTKDNQVKSYTGTISTFSLVINSGTTTYKITDNTGYEIVGPLALSSPTVTNISDVGATLGATITSNGGASVTARGTCWGTTPQPTTHCLAAGGTATGAFSHAVTGMSASTFYYYRGYATSIDGTAYSEDGTFTTAAAACFLAGTMVSTPNGDKAIEELNVGDRVWSWDNERPIENIIRKTLVHRVPGYYELATTSGSLLVTGIHPLLTSSGYKTVDSIQLGDKLITKLGSETVLSKIYIGKAATVYNLEADEPHNYFANGFVVHNKPL
jgi:prepilin-type N-terminal cleavage/methylation domain-containing protein